MTKEETHPLHSYINEGNGIQGGYVPSGLETLFIGTFPPESEYFQKKEGFFYFSSHRNHLWNRFDNIFLGREGYKSLKKTNSSNCHESYIENRIRKEKFLQEIKVGFIDMISKTMRKQRFSSKDLDLIPTETILENGFLRAIILAENIKTICCVYSKAYDLLKTGLLKSKDYTVEIVSDANTANGEKLVIQAFAKTFTVVLLYPATRSRHKGSLKDRQYRIFLASAA